VQSLPKLDFEKLAVFRSQPEGIPSYMTAKEAEDFYSALQQPVPLAGKAGSLFRAKHVSCFFSTLSFKNDVIFYSQRDAGTPGKSPEKKPANLAFGLRANRDVGRQLRQN
jgi:hypothetical protein